MCNSAQIWQSIISKYIVPVSVFIFVSFFHTFAEPATVKVGTYQNPPLVFMDKDGVIKGLSIDILEYIASQEGWDLEYLHGTWTECLKRLESGETDIQVVMAYSEARSLKYDFADQSLFNNWGIVYSQPGSDIESILDLKSKSVALLAKSIHTSAFKDILSKFEVKVDFIETTDYASVFRLVNEGKAVAGVVNRTFAEANRNNYNIKKTPIIFNPIEIRYALPKGKNPHLASAIDRHLSELKKDGNSLYFQAIEKWFAASRKYAVPVWMKWAIAAAAVLLLFFLVSSLFFRSQVRQRTQAFRESEERFQTIFNNAIDGILIADVHTKKFLIGNNSICGMLGYSPEEIKNLGVEAIHPEKDLPHVIEQFEKQARGDLAIAENLPVKRKDGSIFYADIGSSPLALGNRQYIIGIFRDITQRKSLESQLLQAQKMEAVGLLAGGIAHDFNNLLSAISSYTYLLQLKMRKDDPSRSYLDQIFSAIERATVLTQSLLTFSRKQIANPKPIDLNDTVLNMEKILRRLIGEDIEFTVDLSDEHIIIEADSGQIEQVLMNLVTNARDSMADGGSLSIKTGHVEIDDLFIRTYGYGKRGKFACIDISDSGAGMNEEVRQKVFEPFFSTKEFGKGTGLGLSVVYGIIKQHNGYINVRSEPGEGTSFEICLPEVHTKPAEAVAEEQPYLERGTETILLAEDEESVRSGTRKLLEEFGYTVIEAIDGDDAIDKFRQQRDKIDLLILDVIMPKKSGKEVYDQMKKFNSGVKVIFLSGYSGKVLEGKKIYDEKLTVLNKPVAMSVLLSKIREVLDK